MLPLKEFNPCRAYAFPFLPLQVKLFVVKVRGPDALQLSQLGSALRLVGSIYLMGITGVPQV